MAAAIVVGNRDTLCCGQFLIASTYIMARCLRQHPHYSFYLFSFRLPVYGSAMSWESVSIESYSNRIPVCFLGGPFATK